MGRLVRQACIAALVIRLGSPAGAADPPAATPPATPSTREQRPGRAAEGTAGPSVEAVFRKALIAEEEGQDFEAAIRGYQQVVIHLDLQRRLQATALFRLGECYRKLGLTNEAIAHYERVLRDFSEQTLLVTRSREDLLALQTASAAASATQRASAVTVTTASPVPLDEEQQEIRRIQALLQNSPDLIEAPGAEGEPPLAGAAARGQLRVVQFLLDSGAKVSARSLSLAAGNGHRSVVELLLDHGADVNAPDKGSAPIHRAAAKGFKAVVESLLAHGAEVDARNTLGQTALHLAAAQGTDDVLGLLLSKSPDVNAQNSYGMAPLASAIVNSRESAVRTLLQHGADANLPVAPAPGNRPRLAGEHDWTGFHPLHLAVMDSSRSTEITKLLLQAGANPAMRITVHTAFRDATPLRLAISANRPEAARLLFQASPDPTFPGSYENRELSNLLKDPELLGQMLTPGVAVNAPTATDNGMTLLYFAVGGGLREAVDLLLQRGADPNVPIANGDTPLHSATRGMKTDVVKLLLEHGANPNVFFGDQETPLSIAAKAGQRPGNEGYQRIESLLRQDGALDDVPRLDRIQVGRFMAARRVVFTRGVDDLETFTLMELIAVQYGLLITEIVVLGDYRARSVSGPFTVDPLHHPDFSRIRIRRATPDGKGWTNTIDVDLSAALTSGKCDADVPLHWGDVVEIPETDHPLNQEWKGLSGEVAGTLKDCLTRQIEIVVKGRSTSATLAPSPGVLRQPFMILPVLGQSKLLLTSADLARVRVDRRDAKSGEVRSWTLDCSKNPPPAFWLRDGDRIEVPEKQ